MPPYRYEEMAKRVIRSYKKIPEPGYPDSTQEEVLDTYLHFFSDAYHLKEWIVNDDELSITNEEMNAFIEGNQNMKLLQAIVTQAKHLKAEQEHIKYHTNLYWDDGRPRPSPGVQFEERDLLLTEDGSPLLAEDGARIMAEKPTQAIHPRRLALKVLITWNKFFVGKKLKGGFAIEHV